MYEAIAEQGRFDGSCFKRGHDPALRHHETVAYTLAFNEYHCTAFHAGREPTWPAPQDWLIGRMTHARTMMAACEWLRAKGRKAPGLIPSRLEDFSTTELGRLCKTLATAIQSRTYRPLPPRLVKIPKLGKAGFRQLSIESLPDRIVSTATHRTLQPFVTPQLSSLAIGVSQAGREDALAMALAIAEANDQWTWVLDDVGNAFDHIPLNRCFDACRKVGLPESVIDHLRVIAGAGRRRGVPQGSAVSMLLAYVFYNHFLDRPWTLAHSQPLFRYVDDLLVPCSSPSEALELYADLSRRLVAIGTPLKGNARSAIVDLTSDASIVWLGYQIKLVEGRPVVTISARAWRKLEANLEAAHRSDCAPLHAHRSVVGWVRALGPCFTAEDRGAVINQVRMLAAAQGFDEVPDAEELLAIWKLASGRWQERALSIDVTQVMASTKAWATGEARTLSRDYIGSDCGGVLAGTPTITGGDDSFSSFF